MVELSIGKRVRFVKLVRRNTGVARPGETGRIKAVTAAGYRIRTPGGVELSDVHNQEIESA